MRSPSPSVNFFGINWKANRYLGDLAFLTVRVVPVLQSNVVEIDLLPSQQ